MLGGRAAWSAAMPQISSQYEPSPDLSASPQVIERASLAATPPAGPEDRAVPGLQPRPSPAVGRASPPQPGFAIAAPTGPVRQPPGPAAAGDIAYSNQGCCSEPSCGDVGCQDCGDGWGRFWTGQGDRFWFRGEYLMFWTNGVHLPPLVSTGTLPNATILFGDQMVERDNQSGFRTTAGMWLDCCHCWDLELDYFTLGEDSANFFANSNGNPPLARPFYNIRTLLPDSEVVAQPGQVTGSVSVDAHDYFQSAGVLLSRTLYCCDSCCGCGGVLRIARLLRRRRVW